MKKSASQLAVGEAPAIAHEELVWLLGQPHLTDYLDFVKEKVVGGDKVVPRVLADEWRAANDLFHELEQTEAGIADAADCLPLPRAMRPLAKALRDYPYFRDTYDTLPVEIRLVELEKLIVSQSSVSAGFSGSLRQRLGGEPTPEALFHFCLPTERELPSARVRKVARDRWVFTSESTDFRLHHAAVLSPDQVPGLATFGPTTHILAIPIGFGSNFVSVVKSDGRLLLQNGYHRAYTLLAAGITHAPAVVQTVTRKDELQIAANEDVMEDAAFYFRAARPPLLKDFLDPRLGKRLLVHRMETTVEIEVKTRTSTGSIV
ncbi:MAG: hypothetical protein QOJ94_561 [Sphingomonadales bacterium]|jgi:hypothetical protein|nr:hypothetical protein [Sphingomonadales bacterium]